MRTACEYIATSLLPGFRALVAKKLMEDYHLSQKSVAKILHTTQPAISQYKSGLRGKRISLILQNAEIMKVIDDIVKRIVEGDLMPENASAEFCRKCCKILEKNGDVV